MTDQYRRRPIIVRAVQWDGVELPPKALGFADSTTTRALIRTEAGDWGLNTGDFIVYSLEADEIIEVLPPPIFQKRYEPVFQGPQKAQESDLYAPKATEDG